MASRTSKCLFEVLIRRRTLTASTSPSPSPSSSSSSTTSTTSTTSTITTTLIPKADLGPPSASALSLVPQLTLRLRLQHVQATHLDFRRRALLPFRRRPRGNRERSSDADPRALAHVLRAEFRVLSPDLQREPVGLLAAVLHVADLALERVVLPLHSERDVDHHVAVVKIARGRRLADSSHESHAVELRDVGAV